MKINMHTFHDELSGIIDKLYDTQGANIEKAGEICGEAIEKGGVIQVFGSGHSIGFGLEMRNKAGSLYPIHQLLMNDFVKMGYTTLEDFKDMNNIFERRKGVAERLFKIYNIGPEDVFIIISNSGINGVVIDIAIEAKKAGHKIIVVTSWQHTNSEKSRHASGKKLYEFADVVIDNCGPTGDALMPTDKIEKVASISSITGGIIGQTIELAACEKLKADGYELPVRRLEDSEENIAFNRRMEEKYEGRLNNEY
jgi:uncharacterized phosphosugar-binding protein